MPVSASGSSVIEPEITRQYTYGDDDLFAADAIDTSDGNFAVTGECIDLDINSGLESSDLYLLEIGADGEKFNGTFDGSGTEFPHTYFYLAKYDPLGIILWSNMYRPMVGSSIRNGATLTTDGGYLFVASVTNISGAENVYIVKTDAFRNKEWDRRRRIHNGRHGRTGSSFKYAGS